MSGNGPLRAFWTGLKRSALVEASCQDAVSRARAYSISPVLSDPVFPHFLQETAHVRYL